MLIVQNIDSAIDFLEVKAFKVDGHELLEFFRDYHIAQNGVIACAQWGLSISLQPISKRSFN